MDANYLAIAAIALHHSGELSPLAVKVLDVAQSIIAPYVSGKAIRKKADAEADAIVVLAKGKARAATIEQRTAHRLAFLEIRHQQNIEAIVQGAMKQTADEVSPNPVDPDWVNNFFRECEDISEPQMQDILSKILAGEVAGPSSFSRRTVGIVRQMRPDEAKLLQKACSVFWFLDISGPGGAFVPDFIIENKFPHLLNSDEAVLLGDMGLLRILPGLRVQPSVGSVLRYGSHRFKVENNMGMPAMTVTTAGNELYRVFDKQEHGDYLDRSLDFFRLPSNSVQLSPIEPPKPEHVQVKRKSRKQTKDDI